MIVQSFGVEAGGEGHMGHLLGDVPFIVAIALAVLTPRGECARALERARLA